MSAARDWYAEITEAEDAETLFDLAHALRRALEAMTTERDTLRGMLRATQCTHFGPEPADVAEGIGRCGVRS